MASSDWVWTLAKLGLIGAGVYVSVKVGQTVVPKIISGIDNLFAGKDFKQIPQSSHYESGSHGYDSIGAGPYGNESYSHNQSYNAPIETRKDTSGLTDGFRAKLFPMLETLARATGNYNRSHGTDYKWIIYSTTGGKHMDGSLHYQGRAVDLVLMNGSKQVPIWDYSQWNGNKQVWEVLDILRCAVKDAKLNWGGHWLQPFDPQHIEDRRYQQDKEWRWINKKPGNARIQCDSLLANPQGGT